MKSIKWITALLLTLSAVSATGCRVGAGAKVGGATAGAGAAVR